jgi:hypothetical protein
MGSVRENLRYLVPVKGVIEYFSDKKPMKGFIGLVSYHCMMGSVTGWYILPFIEETLGI